MQTNRLLLAITALFVPAMGVMPAFAQDWQGGGGYQQAPKTYNAPPGWPQQDPTNTYSSTYPANTPQMGGGQPAMQAQPAASPQDQARIGQWFAAYDQVAQRQMSPQENTRTSSCRAKLSMFIPGPEKVAAQNLWTDGRALRQGGCFATVCNLCLGLCHCRRATTSIS
ncbi:MAG: hypothetical protein U0105_15045 [Candidatus Obscuribacterales bacterium]